jgi:ribose transport system substrate-binding protein
MTKFKSLLAVLACGTIVAAACGSDKKASTTATTTAAAATATTDTTLAASATTAAATGGDAGLAAAKANVAKYSKFDGSIGVTIPLTGKAAKKTIAWLECDVPTCAAYLTPGFKNATAAIGWDLKIIPMKSTDPGPAVQQAIDAKVDYIASTGLAIAQYQPQLDAAKAAGIPVLSCYGTDDPDPSTGLYMQCGDETSVSNGGPLMADWMIAHSEGKANVLIVSIPDFPVLVAETDAYKAHLAKACPDCKVTELNATLQDLIGGTVPASIVSKLQANPDVNYVYYSFGDLPGGVTAALQSAGLDKKVTEYGLDFSTIDLDEIAAGTMGAWSANPKGYAGWLMVDAAARLSLGMKLDEERAAAKLPTIIISDPATAKALSAGGGDWMPPGAEDAFKKLWGV